MKQYNNIFEFAVAVDEENKKHGRTTDMSTGLGIMKQFFSTIGILKNGERPEIKGALVYFLESVERIITQEYIDSLPEQIRGGQSVGDKQISVTVKSECFDYKGNLIEHYKKERLIRNGEKRLRYIWTLSDGEKWIKDYSIDEETFNSLFSKLPLAADSE